MRGLLCWITLSAASLACAGSGSTPKADAGVDAGPTMTEAQAQALRLACAFDAGALPAQTLGSELPQGAEIPVDHIVLVMQENRSFDHLYSGLADAGATTAAPGTTNPSPDSGPVSWVHATTYCFVDTNHSWAGAHQEWDNGANDGFVAANEPDGERAMGYYDESDLGFDYALSRAFAISDMHFSSVLGPTWPNRMFYFAATSWGETDNLFPPDKDPQGHPYSNLFLALSQASVSWKVYTESDPSPAMLLATYAEYINQYVPISQYYADLDAGALPQVAWVEPNFGTGANQDDEHPPGDIQLGETFTSSVIGALMSSSAWSSSVAFITYDENGGLYDSVPPPPACPPDDLPALLERGDPDAGFDRYGFRTPLIAVSPFAKPGYISHQISDHTSIVRFVETRFGLPAMTRRDANAYPLLDLFDFAHPQPAPSLPTPVIDSAQLSTCESEFPSAPNP